MSWAIAHHFPLCGSRQRYSQIAFKPLEAMKRKTAALLHQPTIAVAVASASSDPTPTGALAVNTSPHVLERSLSRRWTSACKVACPTIPTSGLSSTSYKFPLPHEQRSPGFMDSNET